MSIQAISDELGYRLASLADGEGHFSIRRGTTGGVQCAFVVKMRYDDEDMLRRFANGVGVGRISHAVARPTPGRDNQASVSWQVCSTKECLRLVRVFDAFPLWSKKRHEYSIWREAVIFRSLMPRPVRGRPLDWTVLEELQESLLAVRA